VSTETFPKKGQAPMKLEISVTEALELINEIRQQPNDLFEMIRADVKESVGRYMSVKI
jgi:hypothetical protein